MPRYGTFRYGRIAKYGRYNLATTDKRAIGPHTRYRIRLINEDGKYGEYITMSQERVALPPVGEVHKVRMRINKEEWIYSQANTCSGDVYRVRIRSLSSDGGTSEWVHGERAGLRSI